MGHSVRQSQFLFPLKEGYYHESQVHARVWGHMGEGSDIKINNQWVVYSLLGMSRLLYKTIKIFQNIVIIILLFYVILYKISATNFEYRLLYDIHDLPCSTFKIFHQHGGDHVACGKTK